MGVTSIRAEMRGCYYRGIIVSEIRPTTLWEVAMEYDTNDLNKVKIIGYMRNSKIREFDSAKIDSPGSKDKCPSFADSFKSQWYNPWSKDKLIFKDKWSLFPLELSSDDDIKKIDETFETFKRHANEFEEWSAQYLITKDSQSYIKAENALIAASRSQESLKNLNPEISPHFGWLKFPVSVKHYKDVSQKVASRLQSMEKIKVALIEKGDLSDAQKGRLDDTMANMHHFLELMGPSIIIPDLDREGCALISSELWEEINNILDIIRIAVPVLLIVLGMMDFSRAIISNDEKALKEAQSIFVKRLIAGVVIFFLPVMLNLLLSFIDMTLCKDLIR